MSTKGFDEHCLDLARLFLSDEEAFKRLGREDQSVKLEDLAQQIQTTIEDFILFDLVPVVVPDPTSNSAAGDPL